MPAAAAMPTAWQLCGCASECQGPGAAGSGRWRAQGDPHEAERGARRS